MTRKLKTGLLVMSMLLVSALLIACGGQLGTTPEVTIDQNLTNEATVNILGNRFDPQVIAITRGGTVTWHNTTSAEHGIRCDLFEVVLNPGTEFRHAFNDSGTYIVRSSTHSTGDELIVTITVE